MAANRNIIPKGYGENAGPGLFQRCFKSLALWADDLPHLWMDEEEDESRFVECRSVQYFEEGVEPDFRKLTFRMVVKGHGALAQRLEQSLAGCKEFARQLDNILEVPEKLEPMGNVLDDYGYLHLFTNEHRLMTFEKCCEILGIESHNTPYSSLYQALDDAHEQLIEALGAEPPRPPEAEPLPEGTSSNGKGSEHPTSSERSNRRMVDDIRLETAEKYWRWLRLKDSDYPHDSIRNFASEMKVSESLMSKALDWARKHPENEWRKRGR